MSDVNPMALEMARNCMWLRVRQASRTLTALYDAFLEPAGVLASQLTLLTAIANFGATEVGFGQLADVLLMDKSTLSRNIKPLESRGFVRVARSPADARARILLLTPAGLAALETAYPLWQQAQQAVQAALGSDSPSALQERLNALTQIRGKK